MSEDVTVELDAEEILKTEVNANGQIYLGRHLDGKTIRVAYEIVEEDK
jgi:hypothetical protein